MEGFENLNDNLGNAKNEMEELLFAARDFSNEASKAAKAFFNNNIQVLETRKSFNDIAKSTEAFALATNDILEGTKSINDLTKIQLKHSEKRKKLGLEFKQALGAIKLTEDQIRKIKSGQLDIDTAIFSQANKLQEGQDKLLDTFQEQFAALRDQDNTMSDVTKRAKEIDKGFGMAGKTVETMGGVFDKLGMSSLSQRLKIDDVVKGGREYSAELVSQNKGVSGVRDKLKVASKMGGQLGVNLIKSLGPAALLAMTIKAVVDALIMIDSSSGEIAKNFGVSAEQGRELVASSNEVATHSGEVLLSTKDIVAAQMELNEIFGVSVKFSGEFAADFANIKERTGLSGDAMGFFADQALHAGVAVKSQLSDVVGMTMELNAQYGVSINRKQIEEDLGKLTSAQLLTSGRNTEELVKQVFQARLLGVELSEVEAIANSLLSFESSIQAEMEAELLTGKQLNLEKARQAALTGDLATVAEEVANQMGNAEEFGKMNVIQQEALASAVGMTRDGLASALSEQEKIKDVQAAGFKDMSDAQNQYNKALAEGNMTEALSNQLKEAGVLEQMESATAQEKMAAMLEKIQDLFIQIAVPLMEIITPIVDILVPVLEVVSSMITGISDGFGWIGEKISGLIGPLGVVGKILKGVAGIAVIYAAYSAYASLAAIPIAGVPLGIAAAAAVTAAGFGALSKMKDGVIGPGGEMVVSGPKGSIQLDKDDSIIAGTDLGGKTKNKTPKKQTSGGVDITPLVNEVARTNALLAQLLSKKGDVFLDGNKVGYSLTLSDSKMG